MSQTVELLWFIGQTWHVCLLPANWQLCANSEAPAERKVGMQDSYEQDNRTRFVSSPNAHIKKGLTPWLYQYSKGQVHKVHECNQNASCMSMSSAVTVTRTSHDAQMSLNSITLRFFGLASPPPESHHKPQSHLSGGSVTHQSAEKYVQPNV